MYLIRKNEIAGLAIIVALAFGFIWCHVSSTTPPWSDESRHLLAAKSLAVSGQPVFLDVSKGTPVEINYIRGMVITFPLALLYKYGISQLIWARLVPLIFVMLTLCFWIGYLRYKNLLSDGGVALLIIFFLGQPLILEQATFLRMYAPLGLVFSIVLACLWELRELWILRQLGKFAGLAALSLLGIWIPKLDSWQLQHVPQLLLALTMLNSYVWRLCIFFVRKPVGALLIFAALLWLAPIVVIVLNDWMHYWAQGWGMDIGYPYDTYWDNISGLVRFFLAVNVMLFGLCWIFKNPKQRDIFCWLYLSGLLGGVLLGLFTPSRFIFFSRYFYLPIIAVTVGFAGMCMRENLKSSAKGVLITGYLVISVFFTVLNLFYDRSNSPVAAQWLKKNMGAHDVLLRYRYFYDLAGDDEPEGPNTYLIKSKNVDTMIDFISAPGVEHVYFLTNNVNKFRNVLFEQMTGRRRVSVGNHLADYLNSYVAGQEVLGGLTGCTLKKFEPRQLVAALTEFKKKPPFWDRRSLWRLDSYQEKVLQFVLKIGLGCPSGG